MIRLTTNKKILEMGMYELAHNGCYVGADGAARYRDYLSDVDCREMIKKMMVNLGLVESDYWDDVSDEGFDDEMMENLMYGINDMQGLIALFYRNMWAMADLREKLKYFEDLEEQGLLLKLPCKVGNTVYAIDTIYECKHDYLDCPMEFPDVYQCERGFKCEYEHEKLVVRPKSFDFKMLDNFNKTVFLTKEEAEQELKRLECTE